MTLENLLRIGKLRAHAVDKTEVARLLASAERVLRDASLPSISSDSRLDLAYRAVMQCALAAMLANGYRPATSEAGHHQLVIQSLPKTMGLDPDRARVLDAYRAARNQSDYRGVPVSYTVARECVDDATALLAEFRTWLAANRPDLIDG
jgi:hypothetical protein